MSGTPTDTNGTAKTTVTVRCIDDHTANRIELVTGHRPHKLDMVASTSDGRIFALLNYNGKSHREEGVGASYTHSIEQAYRSFLSRVRPLAMHEENYDHEPGYGPVA